MLTATISVALLAVLSPIQAAPAADEVTALPGWPKALPSKHYSGYIPVRNGQSHVHYYLQLSENDPSTDPITLWSNGGPGCTSLKGAFEELGQLVFNVDSVPANASAGDVPTLFYNPLGWTRASTMLYFEHPTGVGFSYCDSCVGNSSCKCFANDTTSAEDNYDAITGFFEKFPEFKANNFYITGESYAGIYISMLMGQIMDRGGVDNLKGAAIGNGCTGTEAGVCNFGSPYRSKVSADFYFGGGFYSTKLRQEIIASCEGKNNWTGAACDAAQTKMKVAVGPHNLYNMMDFCATAELTLDEWDTYLLPREDGTLGRMDEPLHAAANANKKLKANYDDDSLPLGERQRWCNVDSAMNMWLRVPSVVKALHVEGHTENNNLEYHKGGASDLTELYKAIAKKYRLWIYNGQEDGCVPYNGMEDFTISLGYEETEAWHPWMSSAGAGGARVAAGYATSYGGDSKDLKFVTVKGAGHEVPTYKPAAAYDLFLAFLNGTQI